MEKCCIFVFLLLRIVKCTACVYACDTDRSEWVSVVGERTVKVFILCRIMKSWYDTDHSSLSLVIGLYCTKIRDRNSIHTLLPDIWLFWDEAIFIKSEWHFRWSLFHIDNYYLGLTGERIVLCIDFQGYFERLFFNRHDSTNKFAINFCCWKNLFYSDSFKTRKRIIEQDCSD